MNLNNKRQLLLYDCCSYRVWSADSRVAPVIYVPGIHTLSNTLPTRMVGTYELLLTNKIQHRWHDVLGYVYILQKTATYLASRLSFFCVGYHVVSCPVASGSEWPGNWSPPSGKLQGPELYQQPCELGGWFLPSWASDEVTTGPTPGLQLSETLKQRTQLSCAQTPHPRKPASNVHCFKPLSL